MLSHRVFDTFAYTPYVEAPCLSRGRKVGLLDLMSSSTYNVAF